jgi:hypothetical protein
MDAAKSPSPRAPSAACRRPREHRVLVLGASGPAVGRTPSQFLAIIDSERWARLPRSLARSALVRRRWPRGCRSRPGRRRPRAAGSSAPGVDARRRRPAKGSTTLPSDFDIFSPRLSRKPWPIDALRQGQPGRHQEGRPVDRVEAHDVLADDVDVGRPVSPARVPSSGKPVAGDIVGQRVDPDIHDVLRVAGHRHAPVEGGARDREVGEAALHEADDLVAPAVGPTKSGWPRRGRAGGPDRLRQAEEIALLLGPLDRRALPAEAHAVGATRGLLLVVEGLVADRVPAGIAAEIDVAGRHHALPDRLARLVVARLGGADEVVVGDGERSPPWRGSGRRCGRRARARAGPRARPSAPSSGRARRCR